MEQVKIKAEDEVYTRSCCESCQHIQQSYGSTKIIPEKLSRGRYQAKLEAEGTYECVFTGLILEASSPVVVCYSVLSWSKFSKFVHDPWMIAGPTYNVETVPKDDSALKSIQLPHCLCLAGLVEKETVSFGVLHEYIPDEDPVIEPAESSGSHVKWSVSSLSPVTAIVKSVRTWPCGIHGAVLVYKEISDYDYQSLHIYVVPNNSPSHVENIRKNLLNSMRCFGKVTKNACTSQPLVENAIYCITSKDIGVQIWPGDLGMMFTLLELVEPGWYTVEMNTDREETLLIQLEDEAQTAVWCAHIEKGDLERCIEVKPSSHDVGDLVSSTETRTSKRTLCGAASVQRCDTPEKGTASKRPCLPLEEDSDVVTTTQLMQVACKIGNEWTQIGTSLGVLEAEMQQIEEECPEDHVERVYRMLSLWRNQDWENATAACLYTKLTELKDHLVPDDIDFLMSGPSRSVE